MGIEKGIITESAKRDSPLSDNQQQHTESFLFRHLPLLLCLLLALIIRAWLVYHTLGVIDGDEAMVGIQAQHILRGELPVYFISQAYMGSLEAYLMALLFAIAGSSLWTLRAEPILLSLLLVWLTWKLAAILADATKLPPYAKRRFMFIATLLAALPPLYDAIIELRTLGGYIETFVLMLLLLISAFRLTQRWREGGSLRELALRWVGIGFIVGLGFWVNPLIISAVLAAAIWIAGSRLQAIWSTRKLDQLSAKQDALKGTQGTPRLSSIAIPSITAIPACIVGFAPALYWGATNSWRNMSYIVNNGGGLSSQRLSTIDKVAHLYTSCIVKRIIGGALPDVNITATFPRLFTLILAVGVLILFATVLTWTLSFFWHHPFLLQVRQLVSLPLLFGVCTVFIFCISKISAAGLSINCNNVDYVGRYATPLLLALPLLFAASFTSISMYLHEKGIGATTGKKEQEET